MLQPWEDDEDTGPYLRVSRWELGYQALRLLMDMGRLLPIEELKSLEFIIHDSKWDGEMQ